MNWDQIEGRWKQLRGSAKVRWAKLTDSDYDFVNGKRDQLIGKIQERYGIAKEMAEKQVNDWASSLQVASREQGEKRRAG